MSSFSPFPPSPIEQKYSEMPGGRIAWVQGLLGFALYVVVQAIAALAVAPLLLTHTGSGTSATTLLITDPLISTCFFLIYAALSIGGYFWLTRWLAFRDHVTTFTRKGIASELALGSLLGGGLIAVGVLILAVVGVYHGYDLALHPGLISGIAMGIGAACGEEVLFRGFLFRLINARFGSTWAMVLLALIFGLSHVGNAGAGLCGGIAIVLAAGLLLNAAYLLTDRLWLPIGIHFAWNAVQSGIFGITVSGTETGRGILRGELDGPRWLSGSEMGIEGSVPMIALGLIGGIVLVVCCVNKGRWRPCRVARQDVLEAVRGGQLSANR